MARKSRKNKNIEAVSQVNEEVELQNRIPTALYARLSEANNGYETDDSIQTQIKFIENFIESRPELELVDSFVDNGFSGTKFDRPEFSRMIDAAKRGTIRCIVVKDLSRFGRDYLETGYYIENIFPLLDVRLIAVTDDFDTSRPSDLESLSVPIKNMVNAMYAKDISRKQVAAYDLKRNLGIYDMRIPPYGYNFSEEEKKLVIVPEIEPYIRMIFSWTKLGVSRSEIAKRMEIMGVPTPGRFIELQGYPMSNVVKHWNSDMVKRTLHNPNYAGIIAMGKTKQSLFQGISPYKEKREKWVYYYDVHEPMVSKEEYEEIDGQILSNRTNKEIVLKEHEKLREPFSDCFRGMIYCAVCGKPMSFQRGAHAFDNKEPSFAFYRCIIRKKVSLCKNNRVLQNYLKIVVMDQIRNLIRMACDRKELLKKVKRDEVSGNMLRMIRREILAKQKKRTQLEEKKMTLYTDFADGVLDAEDYQFLKERTILEIQQLDEELKQTEQHLLEAEKAVNRYIRTAEDLERYLDTMEFDEELVKELVHDIQIGDNNHITINFNCEDVFANELITKCLQGLEESDDCVIS